MKRILGYTLLCSIGVILFLVGTQLGYDKGYDKGKEIGRLEIEKQVAFGVFARDYFELNGVRFHVVFHQEIKEVKPKK